MQIESSAGVGREIVRQNDADQQRSLQVNHGQNDQRDRQDAVSASARSEDGGDHGTRRGPAGQHQGQQVDIRV